MRTNGFGRKVAAPVLLTVICAQLALGQNEISNPVLRRLWTLGMDSSQTEPLARTLLDSIGPRLTGTSALNAASDWIIGRYRAWGIDARTEQYGTWRGWRRGYAHIDLLAPFTRTVEGTTLSFSPGTRGADVIGTTILLPLLKDSSDFARWLPSVRGQFVLISPPYQSCRPEEEWQAMATSASKARMDTTIVRLLHDW
ncbi:MAG: hypothetical protein ACXWCX_28170, partial [Burkholderiales bacterium]